MKYLIPVLALILLTSCGGETHSEETNIPTRGALVGKWKLISIKQEPSTEHQPAVDSIHYFKTLTEGSFSWVIYHKESGVLQQTAGGRYTLEGEKYTEHLDYTFPHDASLMSASIPFRCQLEGNRWTHSGYIENREYDSLINDYVVLSKYKLEEIWERVE